MGLISVGGFSRELLVRSFGFQSNKGWQPKNSIEYSFEYLTELKAVSVIREEHYVDRHYLDDFAGYYSRSFRTPAAECSRLHFFKKLSPEALTAVLDRAYHGVKERDRAEQELQQHYLGFMVQRPLERARIGRTVLVPYPEEGRRRYEVVRKYRVNIGGIRLEVGGLAFQEQDGGAAVCASTALWSALQRVARVSGHRSPTPSQITRAANSPYPASHGLELSQMATALSNLGYLADQFLPADNRPLFRAKIVACLSSQLPVILAISRKSVSAHGFSISGHALTLTGFSEPSAVVEIPPLAAEQKPIPMRGAALSVVYAHDDNFGFHAHYEIHDSDELDEVGNKKLILRRGRSDKPAPPWLKGLPDDWVILAALIPKPDKLRLSIESLFLDVVALQYLFDDVFSKLPALSFGAHFSQGVDYRTLLLGMSLDRTAMRRFQEELGLPRHIGVLSVFSAETKLCDVLVDVTEYQRHPLNPSVVGLVCEGIPKGSGPALNLTKIAGWFGVPIIMGPPKP